MELRRRPAILTTVIGVGFALILPAEPALAGQDPSRATARSGDAHATTPRTADGKPDLSGMWRSTTRAGGQARGSSGRGSFGAAAGGGGETTRRTEADGDSFVVIGSRRCSPNQQRCRDNTNQANDYELTFRDDPNRPLYKAEHWDKVQFLDYDTNFSDPLFRCVPLGIPRTGPPAGIFPVPNGMVLLYNANRGSAGHDYRLIPTDGRGHNRDALPGYWGDAVGHWEGDTFVVESVNFNDTAWIVSGIEGGGGGYFHSFDMKVIERFRREGNTVHYQVTVEDPDVLLEPWTMNPQTLLLDTDPNALFGIPEGEPCENIDEAIAVNRIRH